MISRFFMNLTKISQEFQKISEFSLHDCVGAGLELIIFLDSTNIRCNSLFRLYLPYLDWMNSFIFSDWKGLILDY